MDPQKINKYISARKFAENIFAECKMLDLYERVSYKDLVSVLGIGSYQVFNDVLCIEDKDTYDLGVSILDGFSTEEQQVKKIILKSGIKKIGYLPGWDIDAIINSTAIWNNNNSYGVVSGNQDIQELFKLYLDNNSGELLNRLKSCNNKSAKFYYYSLIEKTDEFIYDLDKEIRLELNKSEVDIVKIILYKYNRFLLDVSKQNSYNRRKEINKIFENLTIKEEKVLRYIKKLFYGMQSNFLKCS